MIVWVQRVINVSVIYPCDHMADWQLRFAAAAQHHERVSYRMSLAWEKIDNENSKYGLD